ncbi:hypothetical protein Poli38472_012674 [Pythium oligandrum]|uniref:Uncharacterized protein n=1 Tax=Pythium oligandrum TaxID=41045 RepID=A0A8K1FK83_PYTOL|nr:hypothetical protein Poli38472_012674 [Pythium oligandrum]|eukprot:TMW61483.1 hypothetical protein Poli38472_012674 [Pythium oligandrum]
MKFAAIGALALMAVAAVEANTVHIHIRTHKAADDICYKQCAAGSFCARGDNTCRTSSDPKVKGKCFNYATARWIDKCDPGFKCVNSKCEYAKKHASEKGADDICYKQCDKGSYCARGDNTCRTSSDPKVKGKCFNYATARWIDKCDPGFKCVNSKCEYAKKHASEKGADDICYKQCDKGSYCARGDNTCRTSSDPKVKGKCFNYATARWIDKCDPGFKCVNSKCEYAKKHHM